jgi:DNA-binding transcriptional ArsR family regulator
MTVQAEALPYDTDIAPAAALIADPTRAAILRALLPDRPLAAGELARMAGVSAATASFHLAKLLDGGMIAVARQGRHRYYRLAGHEVAAAIEALGDTSAVRFEVTGAGAKVLGSFGLNIEEIRRSRRHLAGTCIDWTQRRWHLNGALAAAITARLLELGWIERGSSGQRRRSVRVTPAGAEGLALTFGLDLP